MTTSGRQFLVDAVLQLQDRFACRHGHLPSQTARLVTGHPGGGALTAMTGSLTL